MEKPNKSNNWCYNAKLKEKARYLRNNGTKAEACLWKLVLRNKGTGYAFFRQRPLGPYILDFFCKELMLAIELDGMSHQFSAVQTKDVDRQLALEALGIQVLRFADNEVLNHIHHVQRAIHVAIDQRVAALEGNL